MNSKRHRSDSPLGIETEEISYELAQHIEDEFNDTLVAIQSIANFTLQTRPSQTGINGTSTSSLPRIAFLHQVYQQVPNKSVVDEAIQTMKECGRLRLLHLHTGDIGIMENEQYIYDAQAILGAYEAKKQRRVGEASSSSSSSFSSTSTSTSIIDAFKIHLRSKQSYKFSVLKTDLIDDASSSSTSNAAIDDDNTTLSQFNTKEIETIIRSGFFQARRDSGTASSALWYSHPGLGAITLMIRSTRTAVQRCIRSTKFKEISEKQLQKKPDKMFPLGFKFHLSDMLGAGLLVSVPLPGAGSLLRLPKD
jgi:hypothetical protein